LARAAAPPDRRVGRAAGVTPSTNEAMADRQHSGKCFAATRVFEGSALESLSSMTRVAAKQVNH
jgi:hypothetical protein